MLAGFGRVLVAAVLAAGGYFFGPSPSEGMGIGLALAGLIFAFEMAAGRSEPRNLAASSLGLLVGLVIALLTGATLALPASGAGLGLRLALAVGFGWIGLALGARHAPWFSLGRLRSDWESKTELVVDRSTPKILDTSVIIDGRIAEIAEAGFMQGPLIIPQFVLVELQQVADSSDPLKRNRGRRGLDMLHRIQKNPVVAIEIVDMDFPEVREVDLKLIELAIKLEGKIVTNDFNLNKVAQLRGVSILNINDLANCLRPLVLPGEPMRIFVSKEGKEHGQGVGYLDDGTMVVVEGGRKALGRTIDVNVTTVLQTAAGKMIFVRWPEAPADDLSRKDTKPVLRRSFDTRGNGDALAPGQRSTDEGVGVPSSARQTGDVLKPAVGDGSGRSE